LERMSIAASPSFGWPYWAAVVIMTRSSSGTMTREGSSNSNSRERKILLTSI
jgi:hypothetical protein